MANANLAQENKDLRDQLQALRQQLVRLEANSMEPSGGAVEDLQRKLAEKEAALARLAREKAYLVGDIGDAPDGMVRYFSPVNNFRCTFPFRKPVAKVQANGTVNWEQQEDNSVAFSPLPPPWAGSTYDTSDPQEIAHLDKLKAISPYVFRRGDRDCPRPERKPGASLQDTATAEVGR